MATQDVYRTLFEVCQLLLSEDEPERTAETLLTRVLEGTGASRGFLVVRDARGSFSQSFDIRYDRAAASEAEQRFSRSLVHEALESGELLDVPDVSADPRYAGIDSVQDLGPRSVLVAPLRSGQTVYGVLVLERLGGGFPRKSRELLARLAGVAGQFLRRALEARSLRQRYQSLEQGLFARHRFPGIVTCAPKMLGLLRTVAQIADSDAPVLVIGETGTGKELVAQALHLNSSRASKPFVALHCAALPASVLEDELFGHTAGAFTGAARDRAGRIASADGGTLFLDEIGEVPLDVQVKLLRVVQSGELQRLGSDRPDRADVRVVAATHQDLGALVKAGRFRQDLYFRLKVVELRLPPLRERPDDVALLLRHFLESHWRRRGETPRWSPETERRLHAYPWPGNVRELKNVVERACLLATGPDLGPELLPEDLAPVPEAAQPAAELTELSNAALHEAKERAAADVERTFLIRLLAREGGNVARAARAAGMQRTWLHRLLQRHGLAPDGTTRSGQHDAPPANAPGIQRPG